MRDFTREAIGVRGVYALSAEDLDVLVFHARHGSDERFASALDMVGASRHEALLRLGTRATQSAEHQRANIRETVRLLESGALRDSIHLVY